MPRTFVFCACCGYIEFVPTQKEEKGLCPECEAPMYPGDRPVPLMQKRTSAPKCICSFPILDVLLCNQCGICIDACSFNALFFSNESIQISKSLCVNCRKCVQLCPNFAIS